MNFSGANQGGSPFSTNYTFGDNSYCNFNFTIILTSGSGTVSTGSLTTTCSAAVGTEASAICPSLVYNGGSYSHNGTSLTLCRPSGGACQTYQ